MSKTDFIPTLPPDALAKINDISLPDNLYGTYQYLRVYAAIALLFALNAYFDNWGFTLVAIVLMAGRQHSLYILNHDASHYGLFKTRSANKWAATIFSNFVMFHHPSAWSFVQWQRVHYFHHRELFTQGDPNYVDRKVNGDTEHRMTISRIIWNCLKSAFLSPIKFFILNEEYVTQKGIGAHKEKINHIHALFYGFPEDAAMNAEKYARIMFFIVALTLIAHYQLWPSFILLWIVPMYTIFPMILTFMDLTEHRWAEPSTSPNLNSRAISYGFFSKLLISFLPRGLHREHHLYPRVASFNLPKLSKLLCADGYLEPPMNGIAALISEIRNDAKTVRIKGY